MKEAVQEMIASPKVSTTIAMMTTGAGTGTLLDWIPNDIGKLAALVGVVLSIILIRVHLLALKKGKLEVELLERKINKKP